MSDNMDQMRSLVRTSLDYVCPVELSIHIVRLRLRIIKTSSSCVLDPTERRRGSRQSVRCACRYTYAL